MRAGGVLFLVTLAALASSCGGDDDEPSRDDAAAVRAILRSGAEVQRAIVPLYSCLPEERACHRRAGPEVVKVVERQRRAVDVAIANTDDDCLQGAISLYRDSLAAYGEAGEAASYGDTAATEAALVRTTDLEIAYTERIGECGFVEGRLAESSSAAPASRSCASTRS